MKIKLKPCPFCDNSVNFYMKALERYDKMGELAEHYCLICENCEMHGPVADSKIRAEVAWNELPRRDNCDQMQGL